MLSKESSTEVQEESIDSKARNWFLKKQLIWNRLSSDVVGNKKKKKAIKYKTTYREYKSTEQPQPTSECRPRESRALGNQQTVSDGRFIP